MNRSSEIAGRPFFIDQRDAEYVIKVYDVLRHERDHPSESRYMGNLAKRTAHLLGLSERSVHKIRKEGVHSFPLVSSTLVKNRKSNVSDDDKLTIKQEYVTFIKEFKKKPTYPALYARIQSNGEFPYSISTMYRTMRDMGFRRKKAKTYDEATHENPVIILQREKYLQDIRAAREEGRRIYYQDESWVNANMRMNMEMENELLDMELSDILPKPKSGKGPRSILCGVGSADDPDGFLDFLLFRGTASNKSADYHTEMNADVFVDWLQSTVLPKLPRRSTGIKCALVVDRASYHMMLTDATKMPLSSDNKEVLVEWLQSKGIVIPDPLWDGTGRRAKTIDYRIAKKRGIVESCGCTKTYLWDLIQKNKVRPQYKVAQIVNNYQGADVKLIILPVHHPELNLIELLWSQIKNHVRLNNVQLTQTAVEALVREKVAQLGQKEWAIVLEHVLEVEECYWDLIQLEEDGLVDGDIESYEEE